MVLGLSVVVGLGRRTGVRSVRTTNSERKRTLVSAFADCSGLHDCRLNVVAKPAAGTIAGLLSRTGLLRSARLELIV